MSTSRFPGWRVVTGCFLVLVTNCGLGFYGLAVYLNAFSNEKGWTVASISLATTIFFVITGVAGVGVARLMETVDVRWIITGGAIVGGAALATFGLVESKWQLYLAYAAYGLGFSAAGLVPVTSVVARWFNERRSVALSVASTGLSVGGIVVTPVAKAIVDRVGLGGGAPWLGLAFVAGIVPFTWWLILPSPQQYGWEPDGERAHPTQPAAVVGVRLADAVRSRFFVLLTLGYILALGSQVGAIQQLVKLVQDRTTPQIATFATLVLALVSVAARLVGGWLAEVVPMVALTVAIAAMQAVSLVALAFASTPSTIFASIALFGATIGNLLMLQPLLLAARFGVRDYSRIYARAQLFMIVGNAGGPLLLGALHDVTGGYRPAYLVAAMLSLGGATLIALSRRRDDPATGADQAPVATVSPT